MLLKKIWRLLFIENVFEVVKKSSNVTKFIVEDASLNEIFLNTVGEAYEK